MGRIEAAKGCGEMFQLFLRLQHEGGSAPNLVLLGQEVLPVPFHDNIVHLGFVPESEKWQAMTACDWLLMPSRYESLSIALLETWSVGRPAMVNARSRVLVGHCREPNGGLWYESYEEWCYIISQISSATKASLGRRGMLYVRNNYTWERIEQEYLGLFRPSGRTPFSLPRNRVPEDQPYSEEEL